MNHIHHNRFLFVWIVLLSLLVSMKEVQATDLDIEPTITSPSAILMEQETGTILYEKDADTARRPASVTKLMTMFLAFEALEQGTIHLEDTVIISEHAASMGGSQIYLEVGEEQPFQDLLKAMIVSSANDAATAIGETLGGSEEQFVALMNQKAQELQMKNTHFENACGLEAKEHRMSARDICVLSRELLCRYPKVKEYTTIWMDSITHKTKKGDSSFGLVNTNKFLKKYTGADGLKTGYTSAAGFSMSATAIRNRISLIAVVMGARTKDERYTDAAKLLDYGFSKCKCYEDDNVLDGNTQFPVKNGAKDMVKVKVPKAYHIILTHNQNEETIKKTLYNTKTVAPVKKGQTIATVEYCIGKQKIGIINIIADEDIEKKQFLGTFCKVLRQYVNTK